MTRAQRTNWIRELLPPLDNKGDLERHLIQRGIGLLRGLRESRMSFDEARRDLFNMDVYLAARKLRVDRLLLEFLAWGMELEDVLEIAPRGLKHSFQEMEGLLNRALSKRALVQIAKARLKDKTPLGTKPTNPLPAGLAREREKRLSFSHWGPGRPRTKQRPAPSGSR